MLLPGWRPTPGDSKGGKLLVQNVHEFIKEYGVNHPDWPPHEHVIVFDEAQRAWIL